MGDHLSLKWGTLKAWDLKSESARAAARRYAEVGEHSMGAMQQRDTPEQKDALCDLIDALDCETVYLDWDGEHVSKDEAKTYVRCYGMSPPKITTADPQADAQSPTSVPSHQEKGTPAPVIGDIRCGKAETK